jgi:DNA-binding NtrC family response regulator
VGDSKILIVEDDGDFRELLVEFLEEFDHELAEAGSLAESIAVVDGGFRPALAIIDWSLPDASGGKVVEEILARVPECGIIVSTGHGHNVTDAVAGRVGAVLQKPFKLRVLAAAVAEQLE